MSTFVKNLGANVQVRFYVEGKRLGRDFSDVKSWNAEVEYYEGLDEYLGPNGVHPWQRFKTANLSFSIEESDAGYIDAIMGAQRKAELTGTRPDVVITEQTFNNNGTSSKRTFSDIVVKMKRAVGGKGEKVTRDFTAVAGSMDEG